MSIPTDVNEFLDGVGGAPTASFHKKGVTVKGVIEHMEVAQQRDFDTGTPKVYADSGKPMLQLVVTLATDERDATIDGDDGQRRIFAKGQMLQAIKEAAKQAGAKLLVGGTLAVQWYDEKAPEKRGMNPQKLYRAQYLPPSQTAVDDLLGTASQAAPVPPVAPSASAGVAASDLI